MSAFNRLSGLAVILIGLLPLNAFAWGEPGHQTTGSIAAQLKPTIAAAFKKETGFDLSLATTWADCARDVHKSADGKFYYQAGQFTPGICSSFSKAEKDGPMIAFAARNWDQCDYTTDQGCLGKYHFADVPKQENIYSYENPKYFGTDKHDIVHAILAAIEVAQGHPNPDQSADRINIVGRREALLLIAHFVGDLHQPLHVGAIYLRSDGAVADPDKGDDGEKTATRGGNSIKIPAQADEGKTLTKERLKALPNMHAKWDDILTSLYTKRPDGEIVAKDELVTGAQQYEDDKESKTDGFKEWPVTWASNTVHESHSAFEGLSFSKEQNGYWTVTLPGDYSTGLRAEQKQQLEKAGAHLAELLEKLQ